MFRSDREGCASEDSVEIGDASFSFHRFMLSAIRQYSEIASVFISCKWLLSRQYKDMQNRY